MPIITWDERMTVGDADIDREHKQLVGVINSLSDMIEEGRGKHILVEDLDQLVAFIENHFRHEENIFSKTDYPDSIIHIREHANMLGKIKLIQNEYKRNQSNDILLRAFIFYKKLFMNHVMETDVGMRSYLQQATTEQVEA